MHAELSDQEACVSPRGGLWAKALEDEKNLAEPVIGKEVLTDENSIFAQYKREAQAREARDYEEKLLNYVKDKTSDETSDEEGKKVEAKEPGNPLLTTMRRLLIARLHAGPCTYKRLCKNFPSILQNLAPEYWRFNLETNSCHVIIDEKHQLKITYVINSLREVHLLTCFLCKEKNDGKAAEYVIFDDRDQEVFSFDFEI